MAATLTIVNQHGQTLAAHRLGNTLLAIRAQDQVQYQLAGEGGLAPANVEAARAGNDLLVHIDRQQALRIEDYFLLDDTGLKNPLLGMNGNGQYVAYGIVEAPSVLPVEHVLAEEVAVASTSGSGISPIAALATIGGVVLTGAVIASSGKDSDKTDNGTPNQPQTPFDPNQPALPPVDNGNTTPPPSGSGNTNPPPSGGGNTNPPPQPPKPNGSVTIEGEAKVGQTLTAKISDADGVSGRPQYQWLADGQPIQGATQSTYTLTANEKGKAISVQATYTDTKNTDESPTSASTAQVIEDTPAPPPPAADTTAPTLTISATPSTLTPGSSTQLTFKASEPVKGFTADDVIVQGGMLSNFRQVDATTFTATFTAGTVGKASVTVVDDAFVDLANNPNELANLELVIGAAPTPPMPQNHAPSDITLSADRLPENQAGAVVGKFTTVDEDKNDQHTYTVNDQRFEVDAQGNLKLKDGVKVEFAQEKTISLEITTTDKGGEKYSETFTLQVQDDPNYPAPTPPTPPNGGKLGVYVPKPATDFIANVKDAAYGAKGDGQTDDTAAIQKAIDAVAEKGGGIVEIPAGIYMINGAATSVLGPGDVPRTSGLQVKSNVIIRMAGDTVMQVIPNGEKHYDIFNIYNAENVAIMGGTLRGDRHSHLNDQGEWGSGIKIASAKNVVIEKVIAREFWGDAVHISDSGSLPRTPSENVTIYQFTADGNRRQGISITSADKVLIEDSAFKNTGGQGGTPPMAGIDIEPESQQQVSNVTIKNSTFDNNTGYGIALLERADVENADIRNIVIDGNTIKTGGAGIVVNNTGGHTITNNHISDIGKGWYYGSQHSLALNANSHDNTVTGNTVKTGSIIDAGQNNSVSGNTFESVAFVRGENKVGATLTAEVHNDDGAPRNLGYQWLADGKPINGATAATYTVRPEDAGKRISVEASFDKNGGVRETTEYEVPTLPIEGTPNPPENDGNLGVHVPKPATDFVANAKDYGAKGDGKTDDTAAIQKAVDAVAAQGGGIVDIPAGTYMVDAERAIDLKNNVIVRMGDDTVLKVKPNAAASYELFHIHNVENAHILGGTLEGDRSAHTGTGGEWGMGIRVTAAQNVVIEGVTVREMWGDGIYLGKAANYSNQNENIVIYGVNMDHNRRQGISVTQGQGVKILNSVFQNTDGTDPRAGIDLEPNTHESVRDVEIRGNRFLDNHIGFLVANHRQPGAFVENVVFENNVLKGNPRDAIILRGLEGGSIKNNTIHIDPDAHPHDSGGIRLYNGDLRPTKDVTISGNTLYGGTIMPRDTSGNTIADNQFKAAVFIRGNAQNGEELTAQFYDGNGTSKAANVQYQWLADGVPIGGATAARYTPSAADRGKTLTVKVSFTDNAGQTESAESDATPPVDNIRNQTPTDIALSADRLPENQAGTVIGKLATVDPDAGDSHTYTVNDQRFEVDAQGNLKLKDGIKVEFAQEKTIALQITTTDKSGASYQETFTINVQDDPTYPAPNSGKLGVYVPKPTTDFVANAKDFGAKGDGQTDDTAAIQKAIDAVAEKGGGVVEIPAGTYMINPLAYEGAYGIITTGNGLMLKSNVTVKMADDTVLKAIPNDSAYYTIFTLYKVQNAHIIGGTLLGDRDEHEDIVGLWGNGVNILSSQNVVVENVAAKNFWGLGFYVNKNSSQDPASEHITFYQVTADNNRRQGISLNGGHHVKILDSEFLNTHGHMPQSGINIEPNKGDNHVSDVEIRGNTFKHNQGFGIVISGSQYEGTSIRNVIVEDNHLYHNRDGIWVLGLQGGRIAGNTIYQPDITHGVTGGSREIRLDAKSSNVVVENNILHGGSAIANHGTNNTVSENTYKAAAYIRGQAETGEILTAHVMDGDGYDKTKLNYQWLADGKNIDGATAATYTVRPADSGKAIGVRVSFTDNAQHHETADSLPTAPVDSPAPNQAPAFFYLQGSTIAENRSGAVVGKITPIDDSDKDDSHTYRVSDPRFEVVDGELRLKQGESVYRHREIDGKIYLSIEVTDRSGESIVREFNLSITADPGYQAPANHAPNGITLEHASVAEKNPGAIIGKVHVADPDIGDRHTFNFSDGRFEIENGYLKLKNGQQLDYDQGKSIGLSITAKDIAGASHKESFTLNIVDDGKPSGSAKMLKIQSEPELDLNNLERGTEGQEGFVIDGQGVKTLSGFNGQEGDLLQLESDAFTALDKGTLAESAFTVGDKAESAEHRVIYNASTGELAYDPDGSGAAASTIIARLDPALELEAQHIQII